MPPPPTAPIILTSDPGVRVGDVIAVTSVNGETYYGRITNMDGSQATVTPHPAWMRVGQHVTHRTAPSRYGVITGIVDRVVCRQWQPEGLGFTAELGSVFEVPTSEFVQDWVPAFTNENVRLGARFRHVATNEVFEVVRHIDLVHFVVQHPELEKHLALGLGAVVLGRYRTNPNEWLYEGPPLRRVSENPFAGPETPTPYESRYDRKDVL